MCPETLKATDFSKILEKIMEKMVIRNPENGDLFETEYLKRNLRIVVSLSDKEVELSRLGEIAVRDFNARHIVISAIISIDSFRNNIKINI